MDVCTIDDTLNIHTLVMILQDWFNDT